MAFHLLLSSISNNCSISAEKSKLWIAGRKMSMSCCSRLYLTCSIYYPNAGNPSSQKMDTSTFPTLNALIFKMLSKRIPQQQVNFGNLISTRVGLAIRNKKRLLNQWLKRTKRLLKQWLTITAVTTTQVKKTSFSILRSKNKYVQRKFKVKIKFKVCGMFEKS